MVAFAIAFALPVDAQGLLGETTSHEARRAVLFEAMLNDPADLDVAFEYAMLSAQEGDFEAAIATLERMLIFAPNLLRVQLELGVLYYRIGARDTARYYLESAISGTSVPAAVRDRVNTFLAELDRQERRLSVTGALFGGVRYQTNANLAPEDSVINLGGIPITLDSDTRAQDDVGVFGLANVHFSYDLQNQGDLLELDVATYNQFYREISRLDLNLIEASAGPSFSLGRFGFDRARLGVYAILGVTALNTDLFNTAWGGGARLQAQLADRLLWDSRHEIRAVNYENSPVYPTVRLQTGVQSINSVRLTGYVSPQFSLEGLADVRRRDARVAFESLTELAVGARGTYLFYPGTFGGWLADDAPWSVALAGGGLRRWFDGPDPIVDPLESEDTNAFWVEAGISAPLKNQVAVFGTAQLRVQNSNYPTSVFTNGIVTVGLSKRF